ncbi:MAG: hypothetical protein U0703_02315 [Anaerolineae bacterium]
MWTPTTCPFSVISRSPAWRAHFRACPRRQMRQLPVEHLAVDDVGEFGRRHEHAVAVGAANGVVRDGRVDPAIVDVDVGAGRLRADGFGAAHRRADLLTLLDQQRAQPVFRELARRDRSSRTRPDHHHVISEPHRVYCSIVSA